MPRSNRAPASLGGITRLAISWLALRLVTRSSGSPSVKGSQNAKTRNPPPAEYQRDGGNNARSVTPAAEIPASGWKDIFWRVFKGFSEDRIMLVAAGVTFYALLAIFPAIAALVSLYGLVADPNSIQSHLNDFSGALPGGATQIIGDQVKAIASKGGGSLGIGFVVGLGVALWSANAGMKAMFDALNVVYEVPEKRGFVSLTIRSLTFTVGTILVLILALGALVVVPIVLNFVGLGGVVQWLLWAARWPVLLVVVGLALAVLYRYGPSQDNARWRWITPGSGFASIVWLGASMLFSWYVASFGSYNKTYGALGAAIGFMTWIWISTIIVMMGGEINAQMERQTKLRAPKGEAGALTSRSGKAAI